MDKKPLEFRIAETHAVMKALTICWRNISTMNGYWNAVAQEFSADDIRLMHLCDIRYAIEPEQQTIALIRLAEADASENALRDPVALAILELSQTTLGLRHANSNLLMLNFAALFSNRKEKEQQLVQNIKREINQYQDSVQDIDFLLQMALLYGYQMHPDHRLKYRDVVAAYYVNFRLSETGMIAQPFLPLGFIFSGKNRLISGLLQEGFETGNLQAWCIYFLEQLGNAAAYRLYQLQNIVQLKRTLADIIGKYTAYPMPYAELTTLLTGRIFIKIGQLTEALDCHRQTAAAYLHHLCELGVLAEKKSGREKLYFHKKLFDILAENPFNAMD